MTTESNTTHRLRHFRQGWHNLYLSRRFFALFGAVILLFILAFPMPFLLPLAKASAAVGLVLTMVDGLLLFGRQPALQVERITPKVLSLGDFNTIRVRFTNEDGRTLHFDWIDELPYQLQIRDFFQQLSLAPGKAEEISYRIQPLQRGAYAFGAIQIFLRDYFGLVERRISQALQEEVPVFPSIIQMKKYSLKAFDRVSTQHGIKKLRRIGHSYEFEQIKNYVQGDDFRSINWRATGRQSNLMINQYQDERAQQVYAVIDKSRGMKMPFEGLSLMDHAINASLVILNVALQKSDKAGLLTFSDKIGTTLKADRKPRHLNAILNALYREEERLLEANYELLYQASRRLIKGRSLLLLFTNFESRFALERALPILRKMNAAHLLVVIFFENTEIRDYSTRKAETVADIYTQAFARKFLEEKAQMVQLLQQYGIQSVLTRPEELSVQTINKYLELKAKGLI